MIHHHSSGYIPKIADNCIRAALFTTDKRWKHSKCPRDGQINKMWYSHTRLPWWLRWESVCLQCRRPRFKPWVGKIPWRRKWQPTLGLLPGKSHGQRSLVDYSPRGCKESDTTEQLHFTSLPILVLLL